MSDSNPLTDAEIDQRWAWMSVAMREMPKLDDVMDRVCKQAHEANVLRAALKEALDRWATWSFRSRMIGGKGESADAERIAELRKLVE